MRMWMVDPAVMCRAHLLGEHREMHALAGIIGAGKSLVGYVANGLIDTFRIQARHDAVAAEMVTRGYNHVSPLCVPPVKAMGAVDAAVSLVELARRCGDCAARQKAMATMGLTTP